MPQAAPRSLLRWPYTLVVALVSVLPFLVALGNDFVWDDFLNVHQNTLVTDPAAHGLSGTLTATWAGHYAPLSWLSLATNHALEGTASARNYILTNLLLHGVNAALVFLLFVRLLPQKLDPWRGLWAALGALLFAVHPLRVESVVWVTERRDVLSLFFLLLCLLAWLRYQDKHNRLSYALALIGFLASLMAKAWGIVLPAVLLVLAWQQGQFKHAKALLLTWLPFALLAVVFGGLAIYAQSQLALADTEAHGLGARIMQALWSPAFYLWKTLFPLNLSPLYLLRHDFQPLALPYLVGAAITLGMTVYALLRVKRWPGLLAAWLIFLILIAPVSGLAQSGSQLAADRYTYLAGIVLAYALAWGGSWLCRNIVEARAAVLGVTVILLLFSMGLSARQSLVWQNETSLWSQALAHDPRNYVAAFNRAQTGADEHTTEQRIADLDWALEQYPVYAKAWALRGELYLALGQTRAARHDLDQAIALDATAARPYNNRAVLQINQGENLQAMEGFNAALERDPALFEAYVNRGLLHQRLGQREAALADYTEALELDPNSWQLHYNRGLLLLDFGQSAAAWKAFRQAQLLLPPDSPYADEVSGYLNELQP